jgi:hypothetical protein
LSSSERSLIPNLGYLSEAATSLVDRRLKLSIVPTTEVVWLSSPAFHYDYLDRRAAKLQKGAKQLPDKVGSFQLFLHGFNDANLFLRDHPWPIETAGDSNGSSLRGNADAVHGTGFSWTPALQQQFREQFEKMIILDYLIRNTGNIFVVAVDRNSHDASLKKVGSPYLTSFYFPPRLCSCRRSWT